MALDEIANMAQAVHNKTGKRTYRDYAFAINKYLIPFFGQYEVGIQATLAVQHTIM